MLNQVQHDEALIHAELLPKTRHRYFHQNSLVVVRAVSADLGKRAVEMKRFIYSTLITVLVALVVSTVGAANAANMLALTSAGASGYVNGALFQQTNWQPTGSGVIDSFLRIQAAATEPTEQGYNTDLRPVEFDEKKGATFNHSVVLGLIPIVNMNGVDYREFFLDVNEPRSQPKPGSETKSAEISLDRLEIYLLSNRYGNYASLVADGNLIYTLDPGSDDNWIKLDSSLNGGSGSGDMFAYIPNSLFPEPNQTDQYVYLFSRFGDNVSVSGGFEEWALVQKKTSTPGKPEIPIREPSGILALLAGLVGLGAPLRKRTSQRHSN